MFGGESKRGSSQVGYESRLASSVSLPALLINLLGKGLSMQPDRSYLVCATPRSGSTLVCHALEETGVAGRPEEYFEALRHSGRPRRPGGILRRRRRPLDPRPPRRARRRQRAAAPLAAVEPRRLRPLPGVGLRGRHDAQRRLRREADVGLLRRLRQPAAQRPRLPRRAAGRAAARPSSRTSPSSASCAPTRCARRSRCGRRCRPRPGARTRPAPRRPRSRTTARRPTAASSRSTGRSCASTTGRSTTCSSRS